MTLTPASVTMTEIKGPWLVDVFLERDIKMHNLTKVVITAQELKRVNGKQKVL